MSTHVSLQEMKNLMDVYEKKKSQGRPFLDAFDEAQVETNVFTTYSNMLRRIKRSEERSNQETHKSRKCSHCKREIEFKIGMKYCPFCASSIETQYEAAASDAADILLFLSKVRAPSDVTDKQRSIMKTLRGIV